MGQSPAGVVPRQFRQQFFTSQFISSKVFEPTLETCNAKKEHVRGRTKNNSIWNESFWEVPARHENKKRACSDNDIEDIEDSF